MAFLPPAALHPASVRPAPTIPPVPRRVAAPRRRPTRCCAVRASPPDTPTPDTSTPYYSIPGISLPPDAPSLDELLRAAHAAVDASDAIVRSHFRTPVPVDYKADDSPVTLADRDAEAAIREALLSAFPPHHVLGEEETSSSDKPLDIASIVDTHSRFIWIIDPIDGTRAFIAGKHTFTTLLCLTYDTYPILSIVSQPVLRERWVGALGRQTTYNGSPVAVSDVARLYRNDLSQCALLCTTPDMFTGIDRSRFARVKAASKDISFGGDAYNYCLLAMGLGADVVIEADMKVWDFAALVPVVEGAGAIASDWAGAPLTASSSDGRVLVAANPGVFEQIIDMLQVPRDELYLTPYPAQVCADLTVPGLEQHTVFPLPRDLSPPPSEEPERDVSFVESMAASGTAHLSHEGRTVSVSIHAANAQQCTVDIDVHGIAMPPPHRAELERLVRHMILRGQVHVELAVHDPSATQAPLPPLDEPRVEQVYGQLERVRTITGIEAPVTLHDVLAHPAVTSIATPSHSEPSPAAYALMHKAVVAAVNDMKRERRQHGHALLEDVLCRTRRISGTCTELLKRIPHLDPPPADTAAATNDVQRMTEHITVFELTIIGSDEPVGLRLAYLCKEMTTDADLLLSRVRDAPVSHLAALMKEELDKIVEQCANIR